MYSSNLPVIASSDEYESPVFNFGGIYAPAWTILLALFVIVLIVAVIAVIMSVIRQKQSGEKFSFTTRDLAAGAICLAISYALSFFGFTLPMGGTITAASILAVSLYNYFFGFRKGLIVTTVYMLLQLTQKPYILSVWSMLLDYIVPYFALCFSGIFSYTGKRLNAKSTKKSMLSRHGGYYLGMLIYIVVRYTSHILSGILFWDAWGYDPESLSYIVGYSFGYNSFCLIDCAITLIASLGLLANKYFNKSIVEYIYARKKSAEAGSDQSTDGSVTAESDGLTHTDTSAESDKRA